MDEADAPHPPNPRARWGEVFRRPSTWVAIVGFAVLNVIVQSLGLPDVWAALLSAVFLALTMWIVFRTGSQQVRAVFAVVVFLASFGAFAAIRLGGMPAFLVFEGVLLLVGGIAVMAQRPRAGAI